MWFKKALFYRFYQEVPFTEAELIAALESRPARPCASHEMHTLGWAPPFGKHCKNLLQLAGGYWLISLRKEERILPASVVRAEVARKAEEIEKREGRKVGRKERSAIAEDVIMDLMPKAFTRANDTLAIICPKEGWVAIDTVSAARAEEMFGLLREALGTMPVRPLSVKLNASECMTKWVARGEAPSGFIVSGSCDMIDPGDNPGSVKCRQQDLNSDEIQHHIESGMLVNRLSLSRPEKMSFDLDDKLSIRLIRFDEILRDEAEEDLYANLTIMAGTLSELITALTEAMGGERDLA